MWTMGEGIPSKDTDNTGQGALRNITNVYGKRSPSFFSEQDFAQRTLSDENFEWQSSGGFRAPKKMKENIDGAHEHLADRKGKRILSFDPNLASPAKASDSMLNDVQRSLSSHLFLPKMDHSPSAHRVTDAFGSEPAHYETDSEGDDVDDHETDCAESTRYSFQTKKNGSVSTGSKLTGLDFASLGERKINSVAGHSNVPLGASSLLDGKIDDGTDALTGFPSCGKANTSDKSCQCSFCLKAAYIWVDLHYQDTSSRLAELKKSKKLARYLEERICSNNLNITAAQNITKRSAELEFELNQQWRSLFLHTENILAHETAQLHTNFLKLKELREQCKRNLEMISMVPEEK